MAVARMVAEVADALEYAHQGGVIHRDMEPSNLLPVARRSAEHQWFRPGAATPEISKNVRGEEHAYTAIAYGNLGKNLDAQGKHAVAADSVSARFRESKQSGWFHRDDKQLARGVFFERQLQAAKVVQAKFRVLKRLREEAGELMTWARFSQNVFPTSALSFYGHGVVSQAINRTTQSNERVH
jgi:serine/threonine protein kinase